MLLGFAIPLPGEGEGISETHSGVGGIDRRHFFRGSGGDEAAAGASALRAEIDDVVGALDHFEVVLNHDDGMSSVD